MIIGVFLGESSGFILIKIIKSLGQQLKQTLYPEYVFSEVDLFVNPSQRTIVSACLVFLI